MKDNDILQLAIETYGEESQIMILLGELAELYQAIKIGDKYAIIEEIADVEICLYQRYAIAGLDYHPIDGETAIEADWGWLLSTAIMAEASRIQDRRWSPLVYRIIGTLLADKKKELKCHREVSEWKKSKMKRLHEMIIGQTKRDGWIKK